VIGKSSQSSSISARISFPTLPTPAKVKVTIGMDLNPFMKAMVQKPLQEGLEKMVDMLAVIEY
jgi:hypothetical protein